MADVDTLKRVAQHPVIVYDHDTNQAGFELVKSVQKAMPVEACTTPLTWGDKSDLDSYIQDFAQDHVAAWDAVKALIAERQPYGRTYAGTGEEFFDYPVHGRASRLYTETARGCPPGAPDLPLYRQPALGVSAWRLPGADGEAVLRADAQSC